MGRLVGIDSGYARVTGDWYCEPAWAVEMLLDVEDFQGVSWDPNCGGGNIPKVMLARELSCVGSDVADRGFGESGIDFFTTDRRVNNIVCNPAYRGIERFILKALEAASDKVAILARLNLLESNRRKKLFACTPLSRVWISSRRISMPPGGRPDIKPEGGAIAYAWFVWQHGHTGPATIGWL